MRFYDRIIVKKGRERDCMLIYNWLKDHFTVKVVFTILIVGLIPAIFISSLIYLFSKNMIKDRVRESSQLITQQAAAALSHIFTSGTDQLDQIYSNISLQEMVIQDTDPTISSFEKTKNNEYITSVLNASIYSSSFVRAIYVLKEDGTNWGSGSYSPYKRERINLLEQEWVKEATEKDGESVWSGLTYDYLSGAGQSNELFLPVSRVMKNFDTLQNIGYIQVLIDGRGILDILNKLKLGNSGVFFVVDAKAENITVDPTLNHLNQGVTKQALLKQIQNGNREFEFVDHGVKYYGIKEKINNGWFLIGVVPVHELTGELQKIREIALWSSLLIGIVAIIIGSILARKFVQPISQLTIQMKSAGNGNFNVRTKVTSNDEIGILSKQFNKMIQEIEHLLQQIKKEQNQKKEAELRAIKHRIHPHFLFNTLGTIRWLIKFNQNEKADMALSSLLTLLEVSMGKKGTFISVKEELEIVKKFMIILQIRYEQEFRLVLDIDKATEEFMIPSMLLQPIVENAIFHGIVPTEKEGLVRITGRAIDNGVEIIISDNGKGFDTKLLNDMENLSESNNKILGIGFQHIYDSVRLYFHLTSKIDVQSGQEGTTVKLLLLLPRREE